MVENWALIAIAAAAIVILALFWWMAPAIAAGLASLAGLARLATA